MTKKRAKLLSWIILELLFLALVVVSSLYDFDLSYRLAGLTVVNGTIQPVSSPLWTLILIALTSTGPSVLLLSCSIIIVVQSLRKKAKKTQWLLLLGLLDIIALLCLYWGFTTVIYSISGSSTGIWPVYASAGASLVVGFFLRKLIVRLGRSVQKSLFMPAAITILAYAVTGILVFVLQLVWGRFSLCQIAENNDLNLFTNWYTISAWNTLGNSGSFLQILYSRIGCAPAFPVAISAMTPLLTSWFNNRARERYKFLLIAVHFLTLITSVACVFSLNYYLSDVLFGYAIAFVIEQIAEHYVEQAKIDNYMPSMLLTTQLQLPPIPGEGDPTRPLTQIPDRFSFPGRSPRARKRRMPERRPLHDTAGDSSVKALRKNHKPKRNSKFGEIFTIDEPVAATHPANNPEAETTQRKATLPASETIILSPKTLTSFSLSKALEEKNLHDSMVMQNAEDVAQDLDDKLKIAETGEIHGLPDISRPVVPAAAPEVSAAKASSSSVKKKKKKSTKKKKRTSGKSNVDGKQMHFKYDDANHSITNEITE